MPVLGQFLQPIVKLAGRTGLWPAGKLGARQDLAENTEPLDGSAPLVVDIVTLVGRVLSNQVEPIPDEELLVDRGSQDAAKHRVAASRVIDRLDDALEIDRALTDR